VAEAATLACPNLGRGGKKKELALGQQEEEHPRQTVLNIKRLKATKEPATAMKRTED
jgi:hypothetical protein